MSRPAIDDRRFWMRYLRLVVIWLSVCAVVLALMSFAHWTLVVFAGLLVGWSFVRILLMAPGQLGCWREVLVVFAPLLATGLAYVVTRLICVFFPNGKACELGFSSGGFTFSLFIQLLIVFAAVIWLRLLRKKSDN